MENATAFFHSLWTSAGAPSFPPPLAPPPVAPSFVVTNSDIIMFVIFWIMCCMCCMHVWVIVCGDTTIRR